MFPVPCQHTPRCLLNITWVFTVVKTIEPTKATGSEKLRWAEYYKVGSLCASQGLQVGQKKE